MQKILKEKYLNLPNDKLLCLEIIDELLVKIENYLMEVENISENYGDECSYFTSITSMFFYILDNKEFSYLLYIKDLLSHLNNLIQSKSIIPPDKYKIRQDKFDSKLDKFEQKFYTEVCKPTEHYNEEVLSNMTNSLLDLKEE